jgi:bifunctional DNA-binding transcriptional regulator/antitoxin component of YhaV-PrlF toxin-antitoxin module
MAFYVRAKNKEKAKEMLDELLRKHSPHILGYGLEEESYDLSNLPENIEVELRRVQRRGGTIGLNFPDSLRKYLNLKVGDYVAIVTDKKAGIIYLTKLEQIKTCGRVSIV